MRAGDPRPEETAFTLQPADTGREVHSRGPRRALLCLHTAVPVAVDDRQSLGGRMLRHELAVLTPECFAQTDRCVTTKVGQPFPLFFAHVVVVGQAGSADRRPPLVGGYRCGVGVAHAVANVIVVTDRIERLAFGVVGAALE